MRGGLVTTAMQGDLGKPRPALVIQSNQFSEHGSATVLPITSALVTAPLLRVTGHCAGSLVFQGWEVERMSRSPGGRALLGRVPGNCEVKGACWATCLLLAGTRVHRCNMGGPSSLLEPCVLL